MISDSTSSPSTSPSRSASPDPDGFVNIIPTKFNEGKVPLPFGFFVTLQEHEQKENLDRLKAENLSIAPETFFNELTSPNQLVALSYLLAPELKPEIGEDNILKLLIGECKWPRLSREEKYLILNKLFTSWNEFNDPDKTQFTKLLSTHLPPEIIATLLDSESWETQMESIIATNPSITKEEIQNPHSLDGFLPRLCYGFMESGKVWNLDTETQENVIARALPCDQDLVIRRTIERAKVEHSAVADLPSDEDESKSARSPPVATATEPNGSILGLLINDDAIWETITPKQKQQIIELVMKLTAESKIDPSLLNTLIEEKEGLPIIINDIAKQYPEEQEFYFSHALDKVWEAIPQENHQAITELMSHKLRAARESEESKANLETDKKAIHAISLWATALLSATIIFNPVITDMFFATVGYNLESIARFVSEALRTGEFKRDVGSALLAARGICEASAPPKIAKFFRSILGNQITPIAGAIKLLNDSHALTPTQRSFLLTKFIPILAPAVAYNLSQYSVLRGMGTGLIGFTVRYQELIAGCFESGESSWIVRKVLQWWLGGVSQTAQRE